MVRYEVKTKMQNKSLYDFGTRRRRITNEKKMIEEKKLSLPFALFRSASDSTELWDEGAYPRKEKYNNSSFDCVFLFLFRCAMWVAVADVVCSLLIIDIGRA